MTGDFGEDASPPDAGEDGCDPAKDDTRSCYDADVTTLGVGLCHAGFQVCEAERWSSCRNQVLPAPETCNGTDDDCDGMSDDGVPTGECGTCFRDADQNCKGVGCDPFDLGGAAGVTVDESGSLVPIEANGTCWTTFAGDCSDGWSLLRMEGEIPDDDRIDVYARSIIFFEYEDAIPWEPVGAFEGGEEALDLGPRTDNLEIRLDFIGSAGDGRVVRTLTASRCTASCTL